MMHFFVLGLLILINLYLIMFLFDYIHSEFKSRKLDRPYKVSLLLKACEILIMIVSIYFITQTYLNKLYKGDTIDYITVFIIIFVLLIWLFINYINPIMKIDYGYNTNNSNTNNYNLIYKNFENNNNNNYNNSNNSKKINNTIFSKYIGSNKFNNYAFDNLYPNNIDNQIDGVGKAKSVKDKDPDYSAYNGYPPEHICHKCECLKKDDGTIFCGKKVPGMGTIGCSEKWKCRNCKNCPNCAPNNTKCRNEYKANPDFKKGDKYECKNCKCYKTMAGDICGQRDMDGYIQKCRNVCDRCSDCKTPPDIKFEDLNYIDVEPENTPKRDTIIIGNITNNDLNKL